MPCSAACRTFRFRRTKPSARSARIATSFFDPTPLGPPVARLGLARLDDDVVRAHARSFHLEVAADARSVVGDAMPIPARRIGRWLLAGLSPEDRDQVLVVRAVPLVLVGECARIAPVAGGLVLVAAGVVGWRREWRSR